MLHPSAPELTVDSGMIIILTMVVNISTKARAAGHAPVTARIARRVTRLRKEHQLSFDELAARSGLSKGVLVQIEQGRGNPSISTLTKIAGSFRVSVSDLISEDDFPHDPLRITRSLDAPVLWRGPRGGSATLLVGSDGPDMVELWEWMLSPGDHFESKPHPKGTLELFRVHEGTLALELSGVEHLVASGFCTAARTDRPHAYRCHGRTRVRFSMVVHEPAAPPLKAR